MCVHTHVRADEIVPGVLHHNCLCHMAVAAGCRCTCRCPCTHPLDQGSLDSTGRIGHIPDFAHGSCSSLCRALFVPLYAMLLPVGIFVRGNLFSPHCKLNPQIAQVQMPHLTKSSPATDSDDHICNHLHLHRTHDDSLFLLPHSAFLWLIAPPCKPRTILLLLNSARWFCGLCSSFARDGSRI